MWSKSSIVFLMFLATSNAELWIGDPFHPDVNCQGNVTDAVCCLDHLCDHLSQSACQDGKPRNIFCQWDQTSQKCQPTKDDQGNVCCQSDPGASACHDILINKKCPQGYEVKDSCCQNTKWRGLETRHGYVCCNAPCKDAGVGCTPPRRCWQRTSLKSLGGGISPQDYGISSTYVIEHQVNGLIANEWLHVFKNGLILLPFSEFRIFRSHWGRHYGNDCQSH